MFIFNQIIKKYKNLFLFLNQKMIMEEKFTSLENYNQKEEILWFNEKDIINNNTNMRSSVNRNLTLLNSF